MIIIRIRPEIKQIKHLSGESDLKITTATFSYCLSNPVFQSSSLPNAKLRNIGICGVKTNHIKKLLTLSVAYNDTVSEY